MTFAPKITHTFPNGAVNVELTLTFSTGGPGLAEDIAEHMLAELLRLAGTRNVPAIPLTPEERGENQRSYIVIGMTPDATTETEEKN